MDSSAGNGLAPVDEIDLPSPTPTVIEDSSSSSPIDTGTGRTSGNNAFETFSRFNRDEAVWIAIADVVLWDAAQRAAGLLEEAAPHVNVQSEVPTQATIRCWSCGCSSGEEAYYLCMIWHRIMSPIFPEVGIDILGTDLCTDKVAAGEVGAYPLHSVKELPVEWCRDFFDVPKTALPIGRRGASQSHAARKQLEGGVWPGLPGLVGSAGSGGSSPSDDGLWRLKDGGIRDNVSFLQQDVTEEMPIGPFDIIMSRYAVCLYLEAEQKWEVLEAMVERLRPGGFLVIGVKDCLPRGFARRNGLISLSYNAKVGFLPMLLPDVIFRKEVLLERVTRPDDARLCAKTYTIFLSSSGMDPYWVEEPRRRLRERTERKMSEGSRKVLALAVQQGRRAESPGLLTRMERDWDARQDRAREREEIALKMNDSSPSAQSTLPPEEAIAKVSQFFQRLQEDALQRKIHLKVAKRQQNKASLPRAMSIGRLPEGSDAHGRRSKSCARTSASFSCGKTSSSLKGARSVNY